MSSLVRTMKGIQRYLLLALVSGTLLMSSGCSWFGKGDKNEVTGGTEVVQPAAPAAGDTLEVPASVETDGPRPGDLLPLPEMKTVYFDYDQAALRADQMSRMEQNLSFLKANADIKVLITGHCDERGTIEYNFNLGLRRARAVADYYTQAGIPASRVQIQSRGEEEPVALGHTEADWAKNRRAEFQRMF